MYGDFQTIILMCPVILEARKPNYKALPYFQDLPDEWFYSIKADKYVITRTSWLNLEFYQQHSNRIFTLLHAVGLLLQSDISTFFQYEIVSIQALQGDVNPCTRLDHKDISNFFIDKETFDWLQEWHD